MANQCTFYYSVITESGDNNYIKVGSKHLEPHGIEGQELLGKEPDLCCENMKRVLGNYDFYGVESQGIMILIIRGVHESTLLSGNNPIARICYCPFCGANIVFQENLKLRVQKTTRTIEQHYYEIL